MLAAKGYPGPYDKGHAVNLSRCSSKDTMIFHASTTSDSGGVVLTGGGRCFTVIGIGGDLFEARNRAYEGLSCVDSAGLRSRSDIGKRFLRD
ncbi:MAG: hypothetical protein HC888_17885 [Candidatus Competibacteraceae bacterium]|nr:hypothetical protein [Candidatus Competibacteraceae bacterium]